MANLASSSTFLFTTLGAIAGISLAKTIMSFALMAAQLRASAVGAAATSAFINPVNLAIGVAALAATAGLIYGLTSSDPEPAGDMYSSNGKTIVSPKEGGLFSLSDNDEFAAAPGLGDMINRPGQTVVTQDNSALIEELRSLKAEMAGTKEGINQLNKKEGIVKINGQTAGTAQMMGNYNLA